ncbi:hypothetical protein PR048_025768 [Dryococelus australis]|uniref:Uncharacterized protein n=1 Tax=Dryococelus australis TaxID=614101 RepID=A0ABQ9GJD3_9NEOP|nr:hypothetical protein PR048_025768 [Dryococelus australis]
MELVKTEIVHDMIAMDEHCRNEGVEENRRSPRKPADQRSSSDLVRFPLAKIDQELNPMHLGGRWGRGIHPISNGVTRTRVAISRRKSANLRPMIGGLRWLLIAVYRPGPRKRPTKREDGGTRRAAICYYLQTPTKRGPRGGGGYHAIVGRGEEGEWARNPLLPLLARHLGTQQGCAGRRIFHTSRTPLPAAPTVRACCNWSTYRSSSFAGRRWEIIPCLRYCFPERSRLQRSLGLAVRRKVATFRSSFEDMIDVKHVYTEVDFVIGSQFIRHVLDDSEPIADLRTGFDYRRGGCLGFSHVGVVPVDASDGWVISGFSRSSLLLHLGVTPRSSHFTLIGSQDLNVKSRQSVVGSQHKYWLLCHRYSALIDEEEEDTPERYVYTQASDVCHWLLPHRVASVTPHLVVWHSLLVSLQVCYWLRVVQGMSNKMRSNYKVNFSVHGSFTRQPRQARSELLIATTAGTPVLLACVFPLTTSLLANMTMDTSTVLNNATARLEEGRLPTSPVRFDCSCVYGSRRGFITGRQYSTRSAIYCRRPIAAVYSSFTALREGISPGPRFVIYGNNTARPQARTVPPTACRPRRPGYSANIYRSRRHLAAPFNGCVFVGERPPTTTWRRLKIFSVTLFGHALEEVLRTPRANDSCSQAHAAEYLHRKHGRGKWEIPEKARRPTASSGTIPTCENPGVTRPGIEPGSPWWEASVLIAQPPRPLLAQEFSEAEHSYIFPANS